MTFTSQSVTGSVYKARNRIHRRKLTSITIHSSFMHSSCREQLELRKLFLISVNLSLLLRFVIPAVAHL